MWGVRTSSVIQIGGFLKPQMCVSHQNIELYLGHADVFGPIKGWRLFLYSSLILKSVNQKLFLQKAEPQILTS